MFLGCACGCCFTLLVHMFRYSINLSAQESIELSWELEPKNCLRRTSGARFPGLSAAVGPRRYSGGGSGHHLRRRASRAAAGIHAAEVMVSLALIRQWWLLRCLLSSPGWEAFGDSAVVRLAKAICFLVLIILGLQSFRAAVALRRKLLMAWSRYASITPH